jgi:2-dehydro-3-deoxyphosphogluconate aldolase / (4S)-4-hydroxy-2-oxoglutarate aldolase
MKPETPSAWLVAPVLPVVVVDDPDAALFVAGAFQEAGLQQIEITLRTAASLEALEAVARRFPAMKVAAGTVLEPSQVAAVRDAGATLCVSPGFTESLAHAMREHAMPWIPGVATAGEVMRACQVGYSLLKFFPAMAAGGPPALQAIASALRPARNGNLDFIPTGGVTLANMIGWKALGCVAAVGGTWIARDSLVVSRAHASIVAATREALACWNTPA